MPVWNKDTLRDSLALASMVALGWVALAWSAILGMG